MSTDEKNAKRNRATDSKSANCHRDALTTELAKLQSIERLQSIHDVNRVDAIIEQLLLHLPGPGTPEKFCRYDVCDTDWNEIAANEYVAIENELIRLFESDWPINDQVIAPNVLSVFSIDHSGHFVLATLSTIFDKDNSAKFKQLIKIFEWCIRQQTWLPAAFIDFCYAGDQSEERDELIQLLMSAPNKIANYFMGKHSSLFDSERFGCILSLALIQAIYFTAETNATGLLFSTKFLGQLLGRIAVDFQLNRMSKVVPAVFRVISHLAAQSHHFRMAVQEMVLELPRHSYDIVAWYILNSANPVDVLGDAVKQSLDWQFVLKTKLPLSPPASVNDLFIRNLMGYLAKNLSAEEGCQLLEDVAKAWASKISIKTHSIRQHVYLIKIIILGVEQFELRRNAAVCMKLNSLIHNGVKNHIEILDEKMRAIGMITAQIVINQISNQSDNKLEFSYDHFPLDIQQLVEEITSFSAAANEPMLEEIDLDSCLEVLYDILQEKESDSKVEVKPTLSSTVQNTAIEIGSLTATKQLVSPKIQVIDEDDLDSDDDDDLQPYDMSNDTPLIQDKRPMYLRDLREALLETDDSDMFEQAMMSCASLIESKLPDDESNIGLELLRLLIELDMRFHMEDFEFHQMSACVAICCIVPKDSAEFLCKQFHAEMGKYSIGKKVLMLDILGETAKALSKLTRPKSEPLKAVEPKRMKLIDETDDSHKRIEEAKKTIAVRLEMKTRRFAHPTVLKNAQKNRFAEVAGSFFFPLLYGLGKDELTLYGMENALKDDTDNILLLSLLRAVATITFAAQNCPIISRITPEVLQLGSALRFHSEPKIRLAVLQMIAAALLSTPKSLLQLHYSVYLVELKSWLEDCLSPNILKREKNAECLQLAHSVLALCMEALICDV